MRHFQLLGSDRSYWTADGACKRGALFVGEDNVVRFFTHEDLAEMTGYGDYSGQWGYTEYHHAEYEEVQG